MFLPERHLRPIRHADPIRQTKRILRIPPKGSIFYLCDFEVDRFGAADVVADYDADYAAGVEVA